MTDLLSIIREAWSWRGIEPASIVSQNAFGNVIVKTVDGNYWRIVPEEPSAEVIAASDTDYARFVSDPEFQVDREMDRLVDVARAKLGPAGEKCFYLVIPALLGGAYEAENIQLLPIAELMALSGDLARQIDGLPEGSQVELKVVP
jgi:hypothetical protein